MAKATVRTRVNKSSNCPNCGGQQLVPIVYGYPSYLTTQLSLRGTVQLGSSQQTIRLFGAGTVITTFGETDGRMSRTNGADG
jgi:hypothetical protein